MKLLPAVLLGTEAAFTGGCLDGSKGKCKTTCAATNLGRKSKARQKFMYEGDDTITSRFSASPLGMNNESTKDYRYAMRFDRNACGKPILDAIAAGDIGLEVYDFTDVYNMEASYMVDTTQSECKTWQQSLYVQVRHTNANGSKDWAFGGTDKNRDYFWVQMNGLSKIDENTNYTRDDVRSCLESTWMDRMTKRGQNGDDYTKCLAYTRCKLGIDWSEDDVVTPIPTDQTTTATTIAPTETSTESASLPTEATVTSQATTAATPSLTIPPPENLPDYNDMDYTFQCQDPVCRIQLADGQTFHGIKISDDIIEFTGIKYATAERWKAPVLTTHYGTDIVDATEMGPGCVSELNSWAEVNSGDRREDCLTINVKVPVSALENKQKLPTIAYIHGGAFVAGSNNDVALDQVVAQGMAVFNINYRLGAYGFLDVGEVEPGQQYTGNWGLQDQLAALKWIHMFAGAFGGNKDDVCLHGCSAGSLSGWFHLTNEESWPYFKRAVTTGVGVTAGNFRTKGAQEDFLRNRLIQKGGVSDLDGLRTKTTLQMRGVFNKALQGLTDAQTAEHTYQPAVEGVFVKDSPINRVVQGIIRPNTPVALSVAKDDGMAFVEYMDQKMKFTTMPDLANEIGEAQGMGAEFPPPYWDMYLERLYPNLANELVAQFGCKPGVDDCKESVTDFITSALWACNSRWAFRELLKHDTPLGEIYALHWEVPDCEEGPDGQPTKSCHCGETLFIQGDMNEFQVGQDTFDAYMQFFKTGVMGSRFKSIQEVGVNNWNRVSNTEWTQGAIRNNWGDCDLMDTMNEQDGFYTEMHKMNK